MGVRFWSMQDFPSLPEGPLGILAFSASFSLFGMSFALAANIIRMRWIEAIWSFVPLFLIGLAMFLGGRSPQLHSIGTLVAVAILMRNAVMFKGLARWASWVAAAACTNAIAVALWLF